MASRCASVRRHVVHFDLRCIRLSATTLVLRSARPVFCVACAGVPPVLLPLIRVAARRGLASPLDVDLHWLELALPAVLRACRCSQSMWYRCGRLHVSAREHACEYVRSALRRSRLVVLGFLPRFASLRLGRLRLGFGLLVRLIHVRAAAAHAHADRDPEPRAASSAPSPTNSRTRSCRP